jgi:hypothetical protein
MVLRRMGLRRRRLRQGRPWQGRVRPAKLGSCGSEVKRVLGTVRVTSLRLRKMTLLQRNANRDPTRLSRSGWSGGDITFLGRDLGAALPGWMERRVPGRSQAYRCRTQ